MRVCAYVHASSHISVTSFNESIIVKSRVIAPAAVSPYTLVIIASLSDYGSLSPGESKQWRRTNLHANC